MAARMRLTRRRFVGALAATTLPATAQAFDHGYAAWTALLARHVVAVRDGRATQVRYAGFAAERAALQGVLDALSAPGEAAFAAFTKAQQVAFLVNAYNAFTVALILTRWPDLRSIKDLGSLLQSPWKPKTVPLLGRKVSLDDIEHQMLRAPGRYDEPRLHFALNCASIGCPALREEAYTAERLEAQLEAQAVRFMADRTRNRWNAARGRLELSKIFDWFGDDFRAGGSSLAAFVARHADRLADAPADRERLRSGRVDIAFLDYDWSLNDAR
jgi:Protein of unknown function, DUF547